VVSPWKIPLPLEENAAVRVAVYFYNDGWVPITFLCLSEALKLHQHALVIGKEIFVFPPEVNPCKVEKFKVGFVPASESL
jgi:hypothetical protein